jgi:hypothetical protein
MLCDVLIDSGHSFLHQGRWTILIANKNKAMIVSLTKIYCPSDIKKKRTPTVYQNATQYNNQENNTAMTVSLFVGETIMNVFC